MKIINITKAAIILVMMHGLMQSFGQNISVTFTGTGGATQVDSVTATNLTTNESVTLPGNETLILTAYSGILTDLELSDIGKVFPNPFTGAAALFISISKPQTVYIRIQSLFGKIVAQTNAVVQPGDNEFALSVSTAGVYVVTVTTEQGTDSYKVICTEAIDAANRIHYGGLGHHNPQSSELKSSQTGYTLGYNSGEIIQYKCYSGIYGTIVTDSPTVSKNYEVDFVPCTDAGGRNYPVVKIGDQTWMAENLAYLPSINTGQESSTTKMYYVNGYQQINLFGARGSFNYRTYGVLYNWPAAMEACPTGWHLPSDETWTALTDFLGGVDVSGMKLKKNSGWNDDGHGDDSAGFGAIPGGARYSRSNPYFWDLGDVAYFWSATKKAESQVLGIVLRKQNQNVQRTYYPEAFAMSVRCIKD
ncbi:MAG: FISUMP domain-containing protein [Bacteroidales bacterium]|nr:FISUMP domain-containing protein [Bacteroidales bacterium]